MSNERIIQSGIITPKVLVGQQGSAGSNYGQISYDSSIQTFKFDGNVEISGNVTQIQNLNSSFHDNLILLNSGQTGNGISLGSSGIEIDRGTGSRIKFILVEGGDLGSYWTSTNFEGNGIAIRSSVAPSNSQDLTNKSYVDALVSNAASTLLGSLNLDALNDVTITGQPASGQVLQFSNGQWRNSTLSAGVTSVGISAPASSILVTGTNPVTSSGTISLDLANTGVPAGTYTSPDIIVDSKGRITSATSNKFFIGVRLSNRLGLPSDNSKPLSGGTSNNDFLLPAINNDTLIFAAGSGIDLTSFDPDSGPNCGIEFSIQNSGVSAGTYTNPTITVDATGRITSATTGSGGGISISLPSGTNISNKNSISFNSSNSTLAISGTSATNVSFTLPALHGGGNFRGRSSYFQFDQYGRLTAVSGDPVTTANFGSVSADSGTYSAPGDAANFRIVSAAGSGISTSISGSSVVIDSSGAFSTPPQWSGTAGTGSNWAIFTGGLLVQWGRIRASYSTETYVYTPFPRAFADLSYVYVATSSIGSSSYGGYKYNDLIPQGIDDALLPRNTGYIYTMLQTSQSDDENCTGFDWIAFGRA